jgi:hypothetical protein
MLSIVPCTRGFGYVVMESEQLLAWGKSEARGAEKNSSLLQRIENLIILWLPDAIVIEDYREKAFRKGSRVRELLHSLTKCSDSFRICLNTVKAEDLIWAWQCETIPKHRLITCVADRFPELQKHVPSPRKPWTAEDVRVSLLWAAALAASVKQHCSTALN